MHCAIEARRARVDDRIRSWYQSGLNEEAFRWPLEPPIVCIENGFTARQGLREYSEGCFFFDYRLFN